jgi:hypothetical protein
MDKNIILGVLLFFLVFLNLITTYFLKKVQLKDYFIDIVLVNSGILFCAVTYLTGNPWFLLGILVCGIKFLNIGSALKYILLYGGMPLTIWTKISFFAYTSLVFLLIFCVVRMIESIIEFTSWVPQVVQNPLATSETVEDDTVVEQQLADI